MESKALANDGKISVKEATAILGAASSPDERKAVQQMLARDGYIAAGTQRPQHAHTHHADKPSAPQTGSKPAPTFDPLGYDSSAYDVKPKGEYQTREDTDSTLSAKMSQGHEIKGAPGVTLSNEEYIVAGNALEHVANNPDAWGKETDVKVTIDGKSRNVTVRLNWTGKVEAEVLPDTGKWQPAKTFKNAAEAAKALKKDFGVSVTGAGKQLDTNWVGESKKFTKDELEKIYDGLSRLNDTEKASVKGVSLVRIGAFVDDSAGMFESGTSVKKGVTSRNDRLVFADHTFEPDKTGFVGGKDNAAPRSMETITHEIGHAVETGDLRKANVADANAINAANKEMKKPWKALNTALNKLDTSNPEGEALSTLAQDARTALDELRLNNDPTLTAQLREAATAAVAAAKEAAQAVPEKQKAKAAAVMKGVDGIAKVATKRADALDKVDAADGAGNDRTTRLESFMEMIDKNNVAPFTKYAKDSMDKATPEPKEFFAEAFALYKSDPAYLEKNQKAVFDWFKQNSK